MRPGHEMRLLTRYLKLLGLVSDTITQRRPLLRAQYEQWPLPCRTIGCRQWPFERPETRYFSQERGGGLTHEAGA